MPSSTSTPSPASADPREIVSARVFDAPREQVFAAFADPVRLARWWGPAGFRNSFAQFDFQAGGDWRFTMHGPDDKDYPNHSRFVEIVAPARIVFDHIVAPLFRMTITLADQAGRTALEWRMRFETAALREGLAALVVPANEQNFDRLANELSHPTHA